MAGKSPLAARAVRRDGLNRLAVFKNRAEASRAGAIRLSRSGWKSAADPGWSPGQAAAAKPHRTRLENPRARPAQMDSFDRSGRSSAPNPPAPLHATAIAELDAPNWMARTMKDALAAFDAFVEISAIKLANAVECLTKDRDVMLAVYGFPADHGKHLRTSNPSKAHSRPCATGRYARRGAYRTRPLSA